MTRFQLSRLDAAEARKAGDPAGKEIRFMPPATQLEVVIPYNGDQELLDVQPNMYTSNLPGGETKGDGIHIVYIVRAGTDTAQIMGPFDANLANIKRWISSIENDVNAFNNGLDARILAAVDLRKQQVDYNDSAASGLGFPVRK
ncbi:MAG TPA: hypothetical protein VEB40_07550 [Flavipsychrobacter sp.]|nr:hypothetical protein [Flavipsychrobacter sp.]